jgi:hypothetical protein
MRLNIFKPRSKSVEHKGILTYAKYVDSLPHPYKDMEILKHRIDLLYCTIEGFCIENSYSAYLNLNELLMQISEYEHKIFELESSIPYKEKLEEELQSL